MHVSGGDEAASASWPERWVVLAEPTARSSSHGPPRPARGGRPGRRSRASAQSVVPSVPGSTRGSHSHLQWIALRNAAKIPGQRATPIPDRASRGRHRVSPSPRHDAQRAYITGDMCQGHKSDRVDVSRGGLADGLVAILANKRGGVALGPAAAKPRCQGMASQLWRLMEA